MPASIRPAPRALCSSLAKANPVPRRAERGRTARPRAGSAELLFVRRASRAQANMPTGHPALARVSSATLATRAPASTRPAATRLPGDSAVRLVRPQCSRRRQWLKPRLGPASLIRTDQDNVVRDAVLREPVCASFSRLSGNKQRKPRYFHPSQAGPEAEISVSRHFLNQTA